MVIHLHSLLQYILFRPKPVCAEKCKFRNVIQDIEYQPFFFNTFLYYFWHFWCNVSSEGYISQRCVWDIFVCPKRKLCRRGSRNAERPFNLEKFIFIETCYIILYILWSTYLILNSLISTCLFLYQQMFSKAQER